MGPPHPLCSVARTTLPTNVNDKLAHRSSSQPHNERRGRPALRRTQPFLTRRTNQSASPAFVQRIQGRLEAPQAVHPIIPILLGPSTPEPAVQYPTLSPQNSRSSGEQELVGLPPRPSLPDQIYLSTTLPTRNRAELRSFVNHCTYLLQQRTERRITHPLTKLHDITSHPFVFEGYIWRYRIIITRAGVLEDYRTVVRTATGRATAQLQYFATVFYSWDAQSWTVTLA